MSADPSMRWLDSAAGRRLLDEEARQVARALDSVFGDQFLQIGCWGPPGLFVQYARTRRAAVVAGCRGPGVDLVSELDCLAIAPESIDVVLLPHVLERTDNPHHLLREVDRILRPDGHIVALGFNPVGLWGLRRLLSRGGFPPGLCHVISEHRLRDWLKLLSFGCQPATFCHFAAPLLGRPAWLPIPGRARQHETGSQDEGPRERVPVLLRRFRALGYQALKRLRHRQLFAACYLTVAHREVLRLTPIRPVFARRRKLVGGLVNPTTRNAA